MDFFKFEFKPILEIINLNFEYSNPSGLRPPPLGWGGDVYCTQFGPPLFYFEYINPAQEMRLFSHFLQKFPNKEGLKIISAKQFEAECNLAVVRN